MMKYCQNCGAELHDDAAICVKCGTAAQQVGYASASVNDSVNVLFVILAFLCPLFGWIYWGVKSKTRPKCAKLCGILATVGFVLSFISNLLTNV